MMQIDKKNTHWTKERWSDEKANTNKCIIEIEQFISENENLGKQEIKITTINDFNIALENKNKLDKLQSKKKYLIHLKDKLKKIELICG